MESLKSLQEVSQYQSVCFIRVPKNQQNLTNGEISDLGEMINLPECKSSLVCDNDQSSSSSSSSSRKIDKNWDKINGNSRSHQGNSLKMKNKITILQNTKAYEQLCELGYLNENPTCRNTRRSFLSDYYETESDLIDNFENYSYHFNMFVQQTLQRYLVNSSTVLNNSHSRCLSMFIMSAFDMARDMLITPKKLTFAREKEAELYKSLMRISVAKTTEIKEMIGSTIAENQDRLIEKAVEYEFLGMYKQDKLWIRDNKGLLGHIFIRYLK